jgi:hypothetical protein
MQGILEHGKVGEFIVRDKSDEPDCYALSVKANLEGDMFTYILERSSDPAQLVNRFRERTPPRAHASVSHITVDVSAIVSSVRLLVCGVSTPLSPSQSRS